MKKLFMVAIILMVGVGAAMAQKDVKAVGLNLNYGSEISNLGIGAKFQYGITDAIRIEPSFNYYMEKDGANLWDVNANLHYLFNVADGINVYPLAGLGYANVETSYGGDIENVEWGTDEDGEQVLVPSKGEGGSSSGEITVNLGVGAEYQLNEKWSIGAELKYQIISNFNQLVFGVGVAYKF